MAKLCSNCGNSNEDHQNFCNNCGTPLAQPEPPVQEPVTGFVPVVDPQPAPPPAAQQWQSAPTPPPPAQQWQSAPTPPPPPAAGQWQAPPPPPQGQPQQGYQTTQAQTPIFNSQQAKAEFDKSKGLFLDMLNAHKADGEQISQNGQIPPRRYPALKLFMNIYRVLAWIIAGVTLLGGLVGFFSQIFTRYWYRGLLALPVAVLTAFLALASVYAMLDILRLIINIEDNTRRSANK